MVPLVQKELDVFRETVWNTHRIRAQKDTVLPEYQTTSITFQSNITLKTVLSVWVALKRKWRGNGQKKRGM